MHELSVTENLLEIALRHGAAAGAKRITGLHLIIGQLSSIVDDSVQFYWDIVSKGTVAEGAQLEFLRQPILLRCHGCGQEFSPQGEDLSCPLCASIQVAVLAGEEFFLEAIDVET